MMETGNGMGAVGWFLMTGLWVVLLAAIVWAVANLFPSRATGSADGAGQRPEDILDRRLAAGEPDPVAYDELRAKLRASRAERV